MTAHPASKKPKRTYQSHGLYAIKKAICGLDTGKLDRRYKAFRALGEWREALLQDLGGKENVSTQQTEIVDLASRTKLMLDSIDNWLLQQPSLVNHRKRALLPVVRERQQLADALARYMTQLGLEKKKPPPMTIEEYMEQRAVADDEPDGNTPEDEGAAEQEPESEPPAVEGEQ